MVSGGYVSGEDIAWLVMHYSDLLRDGTGTPGPRGKRRFLEQALDNPNWLPPHMNIIRERNGGMAALRDQLLVHLGYYVYVPDGKHEDLVRAMGTQELAKEVLGKGVRE